MFIGWSVPGCGCLGNMPGFSCRCFISTVWTLGSLFDMINVGFSQSEIVLHLGNEYEIVLFESVKTCLFFYFKYLFFIQYEII